MVQVSNLLYTTRSEFLFLTKVVQATNEIMKNITSNGLNMVAQSCMMDGETQLHTKT